MPALFLRLIRLFSKSISKQYHPFSGIPLFCSLKIPTILSFDGKGNGILRDERISAMNMAKVYRCEVSECSYNFQNQCHARAITVSCGGARPMCETFCSSSIRGGDRNFLAGVGACKCAECIFNTALECRSPEIKVGRQDDQIDCLTFRPR